MMRKDSAHDRSDDGLQIQEDWDAIGERAGPCLAHNDDYLRFLVQTVWRLAGRPRRVIDFGCGYGETGSALMSLLPEGSTYMGIDTSEARLAKARTIFADMSCAAEFVYADVGDVPFADDSFDVAFAHAVLMHVPHPRQGLAEMVRVTRRGGMVIASDANRNAHNALLHIGETDELDHTPLALFQRMNRHIRQQTGVDYNIGIKMPILMHEAGLKDIGCRVSDVVWLLFPPVDTEDKEGLFRAICDEGFGFQPTDGQAIRAWQDTLVARGVPARDAEREIRRELDRDFLHKGKGYHTVYPPLLTFSYGTVDAPAGSGE